MKRVYLITGCIGSGKSTYAKQHAGKNDIVFDMDEIIRALGGVIHEKQPKGLQIALAMRDAAISEISKRSGDWENAFFITASSDKNEIKSLLKTLGAEQIHMDTSLAECKERIIQDETRKDKAHQISLAEQWDENYSRDVSTRDQFAEWLNQVI